MSPGRFGTGRWAIGTFPTTVSVIERSAGRLTPEWGGTPVIRGEMGGPNRFASLNYGPQTTPERRCGNDGPCKLRDQRAATKEHPKR